MKNIVKDILRPAWRLLKRMQLQLNLIKVYLYDYKRYRTFYVSDNSKSKDKA